MQSDLAQFPIWMNINPWQNGVRIYPSCDVTFIAFFSIHGEKIYCFSGRQHRQITFFIDQLGLKFFVNTNQDVILAYISSRDDQELNLPEATKQNSCIINPPHLNWILLNFPPGHTKFDQQCLYNGSFWRKIGFWYRIHEKQSMKCEK